MNNETDKAMALVALAANFGKEIPEPLFTLWLDLLRPYPAQIVEAAVKKVVLEYEYKTLPPFALLQKAIEGFCGTGAKSLQLQATAEWARLMEEIGKRGSYNPPQNLHPTTAFVLRVMGGWAAACRWAESALDFKRRDFINHWEECHGNVNLMALGAAGLLPAIEARNRALHVSTGMEQAASAAHATAQTGLNPVRQDCAGMLPEGAAHV